MADTDNPPDLDQPSDSSRAPEMAKIGFAAFGPDCSLTFANATFALLLSIDPSALIPGRPFRTLLDAMRLRTACNCEDGDEFMAALCRAEVGHPVALRCKRRTGEVLDFVSEPLPQGGFIMTVADISILARAEGDAQRRADLLDSILDNVPHGICVYGPDRRVTMFNRIYAEVMEGRARGDRGSPGRSDPAPRGSRRVRSGRSRQRDR